jgi:hypothetical protein
MILSQVKQLEKRYGGPVIVQIPVKCKGGLPHRNHGLALAAAQPVFVTADGIPTAEDRFEILRAALAD